MLQWIGVSLLLACCAYALWRGGWPERAGAVTLLIGNFASPHLQEHIDSWLIPLQLRVMMLDGVMLVAFLVLAFSTRRWWPLAASGFQLLVVVAHLGFLAAGRGQGWAYITVLITFTYGVMFALAVGTWREADRPARIRPAP